MNAPSPRNWRTTYQAVLLIETLWLLALWWLGHHFGT
jgi:hypothetical protein